MMPMRSAFSDNWPSVCSSCFSRSCHGKASSLTSIPAPMGCMLAAWEPSASAHGKRKQHYAHPDCLVQRLVLQICERRKMRDVILLLHGACKGKWGLTSRCPSVRYRVAL